MALDPQLLEILACPEDKGPLLYFEDEDALYNPRLKRRYAIRDDIPIMLIDEAETVDDAEHERLLAKAEAEGITPDVRGLSRGATCSTRVGMFDLAAGAARAGRRPRPRGRRARRPARPRRDRERRRARHGRQRHRRRRRWPAVAGAVHARAGRRGEGLRGRRRSSATARSCFAISFSGDTEETRRGRARPRPPPAPAWSCCRPGRRARPSWPRAGARPCIRLPDDIPHAPGRHRRAGASRRCVVLERDRACSPAPRSGSTDAVDQLAPPARRSSIATAAPAAAAGRGASAARCRSSTAAARSARSPPPVEEPGQRERQGARRSARHVPELCHNEICGWGQHGDVTRQVFTLVPLPPRLRAPAGGPPLRPHPRRRSTRSSPPSSRCRPRARAPLAQLFDLMLRRLRQPAPGRRGRRRPRPDPRPRRPQGRPRPLTAARADLDAPG